MHCVKCGNEVPKDAKFCTRCGNIIKSSTEDTHLVRKETETLLTRNEEKEININTGPEYEKKSYWNVLAVAIPVLVIIIAIWDACRQETTSSMEDSLLMETLAPVQTLSPEEEKYNAAMNQMGIGEYESAYESFLELGNYMDAAEKAEEAYYQIGIELYNAGKYKKAKEIFQDIRGYKGAKEKIKSCNYNIGIEHYDSGRYKKAKKIFCTLGNYMDSKEYLKECKTQLFMQTEVEIYEWTKTYDSAWDYYAYGDGVEYTVSWYTPEYVDGYEVYVGQSEWEGEWYEETFTTTDTSTSVQFSSMYQLKACVRPYKYIDGEIVYGQWSNTQYVTFSW